MSLSSAPPEDASLPPPVSSPAQMGEPGTEPTRADTGKGVASSSVQRKIDELLMKSLRVGDLRDWQECDLPGGVRDLCADIVQHIKDFDKEETSSSSSFPIPPIQSALPVAPEDPLYEAAPETPKFSSPHRCEAKLYAGVDQNDFEAAQAESDLLGATRSITKLKNDVIPTSYLSCPLTISVLSCFMYLLCSYADFNVVLGWSQALRGYS